MLNVEILKVEFYDYTMKRLVPTNVTIETYNQYEINEEVTDVQWGTDTQRRIHANVKIAENVLDMVSITQSSNNLRLKHIVTFVKLDTIEQEYTKFKFIQ